MSSLYKLDLFRTLPTKMGQQTVLGSIITVIVLILSGYLMIYELSSSVGDTIRSELVFNDLHMKDLLIYLDVDLFHLPCEILDMRFVSQPDRQHDLHKSIIDKNGNDRVYEGQRDMDEIMEGIRNGEGCKISGTFYKHFVFNEFVILVGNPFVLAELLSNNEFNFDLSHRINNLFMGSQNLNSDLLK